MASSAAAGHVPRKRITGEGLLRAVEAEAEALRIMHVRIQKQLQNLETEEKLLQHMVQRLRNRHSNQELQAFDQQYVLEQQQQQLQPQRLQPPQQQQPAAGQPDSTDQLQTLLQEHPLLAKHRQHMNGFKPRAPGASP